MQGHPKLLSASELARTIGVSPDLVYALRRRNSIPSYQAGRRVLFDLEDVLEALRRPAVQQPTHLAQPEPLRYRKGEGTAFLDAWLAQQKAARRNGSMHKKRTGSRG